MSLGERIIALRKQSGMTQEQLAEKIGVTRQTISKWELDQSTPDLRYINILSDNFNVSTDYLIKGSINVESESDVVEKIDFEPNKKKNVNKNICNILAVVAVVVVLAVIVCIIIVSDKTQEQLMKEYKEFEEKNFPGEEILNTLDGGVYYEVSSGETLGEESFSKYDEYEKVWSVIFENSIIEGYDFIEEDILVYGENYCNSSDIAEKVWMARLDIDGNIIWKKTFENGYDEYLMTVMVDGDNIYAIVRVEKNDSKIPWYITLMEVNGQGEVINYAITDIEGGVIDAVKSSEGVYFVLNPAYYSDNVQKVIKLNSDGTYDVVLKCENYEKAFDICDLQMVNDKLYISVTETNIADFDTGAYAFYDVNHENMASDGMSYFNKKQIKILKEKYTAKLFEYDEQIGKCQEVFEEHATLGCELDINDKGQLVWNVQTIEKALYSIATSSFSVETMNFEYEYVFDEDGIMISNKKKKWAVCYRM